MRHQMKQEQNNFIDLMAYPFELAQYTSQLWLSSKVYTGLLEAVVPCLLSFVLIRLAMAMR